MTNNSILSDLFSDRFATVRPEPEERTVFDAMIAHFFELPAEQGRLLERTTDEERRKRVRTAVPSSRLSPVLRNRLDIQ